MEINRTLCLVTPTAARAATGRSRLGPQLTSENNSAAKDYPIEREEKSARAVFILAETLSVSIFVVRKLVPLFLLSSARAGIAYLEAMSSL
ncbi:hypothetical protein NKH53_18465 [Mesorhizobium australicum]|uniref:hypothetical protein n=1 Tax=Mesorhizobium australicum TaxID=536018 RepID=UPI00333D630D